MKYIICFTLGILVLVNYCFAQGFSLSLSAEPQNVIVGVPILIKVKMTADETFVLHGTFGGCNGHLSFNVQDDSGNRVDLLSGDCPASETNPLDSYSKIEYPGLAEHEFEAFLPIGTYELSAEYHSLGPYLDRYSQDDIRPVDGIWIGELTSNTLELNVTAPEDGDQNVLLNLGPKPADLRSEEALRSFLDSRGDQILKDYPKSTYAAWVRWRWGKGVYDDSSLQMKSLSVNEEFVYNNYLKRMESGELGSTSSFRPMFLAIIEAWEPLYKNFPKFIHRPEVLKGLAQAYIRIGEHKKAVPLISELLEKFVQTEPGKRAAKYKDLLIKNKFWN
jgi:hypothetical protein